jgi:hypothetical protein
MADRIQAEMRTTAARLCQRKFQKKVREEKTQMIA